MPESEYEYLAETYSVRVEPLVGTAVAARSAEGWDLFSVSPCWMSDRIGNSDARELQNLFVWRRRRATS